MFSCYILLKKFTMRSIICIIIFVAAVHVQGGYSTPQVEVATENKTCGTGNSVTARLHRYYNNKNGDHFYTINWSELGGGKGDYVYEGVQASIFASPETGTSVLHRYYNSRNGDHFYTTNWAELKGGSLGYVYEGIAGYVYPNPITGTIPLFRYYNGGNGDHFYTTNWAELGGGKGGYIHEGIAGFVFQS